MSSHISGNSFLLENVYIKESATVAGKLERDGPLGQYFDKTYPDHHFHHKSYETAEIAMIHDAFQICLKKAKENMENIDLYYGGDLNNQLTATYYFARNLTRPMLGMYGACSTMALTLNQASILIENQAIQQAMILVSSHNATAERQFRYPVEYGIQRRGTTTFTATGSVAVLLSHETSRIKVDSITFGKVVDYHQDDANDMGRAMAPAAFDTLYKHLHDLHRSIKDYDMVLTGDLSRYGSRIMKEFMNQYHIDTSSYYDCGSLLYDKDQNIYQGGSGVACSALVVFGYIKELLQKKKLHRILIIATGALLSPVMTNQKQTIPCVAHAFSLEVL